MAQSAPGIAIDRGDVQRTGVYATDGIASPSEKLWQSDPLFVISGSTDLTRDRSPYWLNPSERRAWSFSTPVLHDGVVYFSVFLGDGTLFAVDANTGKRKWIVTRLNEQYSPPTIVGDTLFVGADRTFHAIELKTQREIWSFAAGGSAPSRAAPLVVDGVVFVGGSKGKFYALDSGTGARKWFFQANDSSEWRPPVYADGKIICAQRKGSIFALNAETGRELWSMKARKGNYYLLVSGATIFYVDSDKYIHAVDSISGVEKLDFSKKNQAGSQLAAAAGKLFFNGGDSGSIRAVDELRGEEVWKYRTRTHCSEPAIAGKVLYVTCRDQKVHALDIATGKKIWAKDTGQRSMSAPMIADGALYFLADDGRVHAIR